MSIDSNELQQLFSSIVSLVESYGLQNKRTPATRKIECRWMIASVLVPKTSGDRRADTPLLEEISGRLNSRYGRGFGVPCLRDMLEVYRAFPNKEELGSGLSWAHYLALAKEPNHEKRLLLMKKASERRWSADTLTGRVTGSRRGRSSFPEPFDRQILDLARTYACTCGIIPVNELESIYREVCSSPVDEYDFRETLQYMDEISTDKDEPSLWKHLGVTYVIDRALANPVTADEPGHDYRYECGWNRTYMRPSAFLGALRQSYAGYVERRRIELIEAHEGTLPKRLGEPGREARDLASLPQWRDIEHLREYCIGDASAGSYYEKDYRSAFTRGIEQLVRHVSQHGIPSDDEINEDARFLLARTDYNSDGWGRHGCRSSQYVVETLKSIYWQVPLWEENGRSARELEEVSLGNAA